MITLPPPGRALALCSFALAALAGRALADVKLPEIFGDHMVLQRDAAVPVWGWAAAGEKITVTLGPRSASVTADAQGKWRVDLPAGPKSNQAQTLRVAGANTLSFQDVLVGDVWIAAGQSNMEFDLQSDSRGPEAIAQANDPGLRLFLVPGAAALEPQGSIKEPARDSRGGRWQVCTPEAMRAKWGWGGFSAAGYFFARDLRRSINAPVGVIEAAQGGTPAQAWTSIDGLGKEPKFARYLADHQTLVDRYVEAQRDYPAKRAEYETAKQAKAENEREFQAALARWEAAAAQASAAGQAPPARPTAKRPPSEPTPPEGGSGRPGNLFNGMIAPVIPYAIKGVIWYQGESNADRVGDAVEYAALFPRLINDWREKWCAGDFPFLFVELAAFRTPAQTPSEGIWTWLRESQRKALALPNTGMATAVDIGDPADSHPKDKLDLGRRLALVARNVAYGEKDLVFCGPMYESSRVEGSKIRLRFRHRGGGLTMGVPPWTPTGQPPPPPTKLTGFGIAGADGNFVWADAVIDRDEVVVSSPEIPTPAAVRYNWADCPSGNLYNKDGLPASPFRTDNWPIPANVTETPAFRRPPAAKK